jgi:hypothetical protein
MRNRLVITLAVCGALAPASSGKAQQQVESYVAFLSEADHFNSSGERLRTAAAYPPGRVHRAVPSHKDRQLALRQPMAARDQARRIFASSHARMATAWGSTAAPAMT